MALRFAEPPSLVGTAGGQMAEEWPGAVAVVIADWVERFGVSPGNNRGACGLLDGGAVMPAVLFADPVVTGPPEADPDEDDDPVGKGIVGTLSGSDPIPLVDAV